MLINSFGYTTFGNQSLRISNSITSGSFGDQTFAKPVTDAAGEVDSTDGAFSRGTLQSHFEAQFDIASTMSSEQSGMAISVSPDRGDGSRMSYLSFADTATGIDVTFYDVQGTDNPANFVPTDSGELDRSTSHTIKFDMDLVDGPSNDVVKIYIDGVLVHTGTSWENYYRYDSEASAEQSPRIVKTLIFRTAGTAAPENAGEGYLFDNLSLFSGPIPEEPVDPYAVPEECSDIPNLGAPIIGTNGSDSIKGTDGNDLIFALGGSDSIKGGKGHDCIVGGNGDDSLNGQDGNDVILGGNGSDSIKGGNGNDTLFGESGSDSLKGQNGKDYIDGGEGNFSDAIKGGRKKDTCINADSIKQCEVLSV